MNRIPYIYPRCPEKFNENTNLKPKNSNRAPSLHFINQMDNKNFKQDGIKGNNKIGGTEL